MLERLLRAFLVVGGVSVACAWTRPARFPQPILDARLGDGSRVAICVPPASPHVAITVRRFGTRSF